MEFSERLDIVKELLIIDFKNIVSENHNKMFDMWIQMEADMAFGYGYQNKFKEHFGNNIDKHTLDQLWFAGKNIIYAINSFITIKSSNYELEELLHFIEEFVSQQFNDFQNDYESEWYDEDDENKNLQPGEK